ncbi:hypothetical protein HPB48_000966 [Haemaphysalis longicornis]|uniref:Uncharacterized protein n=1 Tax=Haemaphysalis longicornis TaxID=44386 RepID=A0A9J6H5N6_HAELO|nr:hypothetical protein HPB48_000966 [Haemaphysalis longicornis]
MSPVDDSNDATEEAANGKTLSARLLRNTSASVDTVPVGREVLRKEKYRPKDRLATTAIPKTTYSMASTILIDRLVMLTAVQLFTSAVCLCQQYCADMGGRKE